jgi:hypothetical protein
MKERKKKKGHTVIIIKNRFRNLVQFSLLIKVLELFLRYTILVLMFKWKL